MLGAGVMGAQIAAHLVNADVPVILFDLPAKEGRRTAWCRRPSTACAKLEPAPARVARAAPHGSTRRTTTTTCRGSPSATS